VYGGSSRPDAIEAHDIAQLTDDPALGLPDDTTRSERRFVADRERWRCGRSLLAPRVWRCRRDERAISGPW
jgi:hypothetical protein